MMTTQRIIGLVCLVVGIALLVYGLNASHSLVDQAKHMLFGRFTRQTALYIFGGIALGITGLALMAFGGRRV